jgi:hypothetical protein
MGLRKFSELKKLLNEITILLKVALDAIFVERFLKFNKGPNIFVSCLWEFKKKKKKIYQCDFRRVWEYITGNITFEIPVRKLYCPVTISGLILITAHALLMFKIRTVRLLDISCCLSHLICQLTLIHIFFS